jgi:hypothetical protein
MTMLESVTEEIGAVMLTLASALFFEELTLGGLVKLIAAPKRKVVTTGRSPHRNEDSSRPA